MSKEEKCTRLAAKDFGTFLELVYICRAAIAWEYILRFCGSPFILLILNIFLFRFEHKTIYLLEICVDE